MRPTRFQQRTADYAFQRLWSAKNPAHRFLVADEVGLGKTMVAREIISQTLKRFTKGRVDILYVCSSQAIASQNLTKLVVGGAGHTEKATRLSLMALGDAKAAAGAAATRVRYYAITPDTSFNLGRAGGAVRERALIYWALKRRLRPAGLSLLLRERVNDRSWERELEFVGMAALETTILRAFIDAVLADADLVAAIRGLAKEAASGERDRRFMQARSRTIGRLREKLAAAGVEAVAPTSLIIVDEFQKFSHLLRAQGPDATLAQQLAARLFQAGEPGRRVLLLSATPYRLPGVASSAEEKPFDSFVDLIRFMAGDKAADDLDRALTDFASALRTSEPDTLRIEEARDRAQEILSSVMARTERVSWTPDANSMVEERVVRLTVDADDLAGGIAARKISRLIKAHDPIEYWKSAPYFLDFMRDYQFRKLAMATHKGARRVVMREARGRLLLDQSSLRRLKVVPAPNARLRHLIEDALPPGAEKLLWVPPSLPYLEPWGAFATAGPGLKRLVFSEWRLAPDAIAALTSYEAERRLSAGQPPVKKRRGPRAVRDAARAHAEFAKHGDLLRLTRSGRHSGGSDEHHPAALALLISSQRLADLGDPLAIALKRGRAAPAATALQETRKRIATALSKISPAGPSKGRVDERWYWAAPLLMDLQASKAWLSSKDPLGQALEKGSDLGLATGIAQVLEHPDDLGVRPPDLDRVLAMLALAGPAVCALRSMNRMLSGALGPNDARRAAFHIARGFQTLFNQSDATVAIQQLHRREPAYWRQALAYCLDGNLQALLDEQLHLSAEALSLFEGTIGKRIETAAKDLHGALTLRRAVVEVSGLERRRGRAANVESVPLRCRHALRFAEIKEPDGGVSRLDVVRAAFNSPFRPFVLASTTVGQEGLDFHPWCHAVVHWNLPRSPVELEQREGRVHRYKGQAVRLNVAAEIGLRGLAGAGLTADGDPWAEMFDQAGALEPDNELAPNWLFEKTANPTRVKRIVPLLEMSREDDLWPRLRARLGIYRLVMGLPRQEDLLSALEHRVTAEKAKAWAIDLRPPVVKSG